MTSEHKKIITGLKSYYANVEKQKESYEKRFYALLETLRQIEACDAGAICCRKLASEAIEKNQHSE